ncbi:MAG: LruC domain-containing protein [Bacteroides sp.]
MRLIFNKTLAVSFIALASITTSCIENDKDLYDPNYKLENPLKLIAPPDFDATTTKAASVNIEVNDEFAGQYYYLVEVFDKNPLFDESANALTKGVAKKGEPYSSPITYLKGQKGLYIQQTDPRGRKEVIYTEIPSSNNSIQCSFVENKTAIPQSRAAVSSRAGSNIEVPNYESIPANAIEIDKSSIIIENNTAYKITQNYTGTFQHWGVNSAKLYISGTWTLDNFRVQSGLEIIVMNGGKIIANGLTLIGTSGLSIMKGGEVSIDGNLNLTDLNKIYNLGKLTLGSTSNNPGLFYNGADAVLTTGTFMLGGANNYNEGIINAKVMKTSWGSTLKNNCQINVEQEFQFNEGTLIQEKGAIMAHTMQFNNTKIELNNGSMLKASQAMNLHSGCTISSDKASNTSLIKSPVVNFSWNITYSGNLIIETDSHPTQAGSYQLLDGAKMSKYNGSAITIITCAGEVNTPEGGTPPQEPGPIEIKDNYVYTYAFEDQWPIYGDYDMNDIVLRISNVKLSKKGKYISELDFDYEIMAVGAFNNISMGLQLDGINPAYIDEIDYSNSSNLGLDFFDIKTNGVENNQKIANIPLFYNAHKVFDDKSSTPSYINTVKTQGHRQTQKIKVEVEFKNNSVSSLTMSDFNLFIITENKKEDRKEIHLPGYKPTDLATTFYFGKNNDCSLTKKYYVSDENLGWGILVAEPKAATLWRWPSEKNMIKEAYPEFAEWVISGGKDKLEWYQNWNNDLVY